MKNLNIYLLAILLITAFSCSDDDDSGSSNVAGQGNITFSVDGEEKSFDGSAFYLPNDNVTNITDVATGIPNISIVLNDVAPGDEITLDLQDPEDNNRVTISHNLDADDSNSADASDLYTNGNINSTQGQITITEYTDSKISGEFNAVLKNPFSEEISVQNGTFSDLNVQ